MKSGTFSIAFGALTQRGKHHLDKTIAEQTKHLKSEEKKNELIGIIKKSYYEKYRGCVHLIYHNQDAFIAAVINGEPYNVNLNLLLSKICIKCAIKLFIKSKRLKHFMMKLKKLCNDKTFNIEEIKNEHQFISFGVSFLLLLQNPLIIRYIIRSSTQNPKILQKIYISIYSYYTKWIKVLKPRKWPYKIKDIDPKRHKYVSNWTLSAIDHHTQSVLTSLVYKLNHKLLKYFLFDLNKGAFFKKYAYDVLENTMKEGKMNMVPMTHSTLLYVPELWWQKIFRNKSYILTILQNKTYKHYGYIEELSNLINRNPKMFMGEKLYPIHHYKSSYLKQHEYYTICGNRKCQIGYFEHKYGEPYFDGVQVIRDFAFDGLEEMKRSIDDNEWKPKPMFVWKLQKKGKWYLCKRCKMVYYCSRKCQKIDWSIYNHKKFCFLAQKL